MHFSKIKCNNDNMQSDYGVRDNIMQSVARARGLASLVRRTVVTYYTNL